MNCPNCRQPVSSDAAICPNCSADLVEVTVGEDQGPVDVPRARRPSWLIFGGVAAAVLAVGLTAWAVIRPANAGSELADRFPADALFYAEIDVAELTSADSRRLVEAFAPLIEAETGEPFDFDDLIDRALESLDSELGEFDISFDDDIASWATGPIAFAALPGPEEVPDRAALIVAGDDADALDAFLAKWAGFPTMDSAGTVDIGGVAFQRFTSEEGTNGLVGRDGTDFVLATDEEAAAALVAPPAGATLADVAEVSAQMEQLPGNAAAVFVLNGAEMTDSLAGLGMGGFGGAGMLGLATGAVNTDSVLGWTTGAVTADARGVRVDYVTNLADTPAPTFSDDLTEALPADTVAFFRIGSVIDQVESLANSEMFAAMAESMQEETGVALDEILALFSEDGGIAIWPSTDPELPVNGALVGVAAANQKGLVDRLADLAGTMGLVATPVDDGYSFSGLITLGTRDNLTLLTTDGDLIAEAPVEPFTEGALFGRAADLVDGDLVFAVDLEAVIDLVDGFVGVDDPEAAEMLRCLPLGVAAGGVGVSGETVKATTFLEITERC